MADIRADMNSIKSFTCTCEVRDDDVYIVEPSPQMCAFFGTTEASYHGGILARIRKDIGDVSADALGSVLFKKAAKGEDFSLVYPSMRADGSHCDMQLDAYAGDKTDKGRIYQIIEMDITELVEAKQEAERLTAENKMLLDDSPVGLGIYQIKGHDFDLVFTNAEYYKIHHGSKEYWDRFQGRDALERILPEDREIIKAEWKNVLNNPNHIYSASYRCLGEDNTIHWIRLLGRLGHVMPDGRRVCYASYLDIDAEKAAEEKAKELEKSLITTINKLPSSAVLYKLNQSGSLRAESISDEFRNLVGYGQEEVWTYFGDDAFVPVHPDDRAMVTDIAQSGLRDGKAHHTTYRILTKSNKYKWVSVNFIGFTVEDDTYAYVVYTDIDDVKKQEFELQKQYQDAQTLIDSLSETHLVTMRVNVSCNRVELRNGVDPVSDGFEESYEAALERVMTCLPRKSDRKLYRSHFSSQALLEAFQAGKERVELEYLYKPEEGSVMWVRSMLTLMKRPGTDDVIAFIIVDDISSEKTINMIVNNTLIKNYDFISLIDVDNNTVELLSVNSQSSAVNEVHGGLDYDMIMRSYVEKHVVPEEKQACIHFMTLANVLDALDKQEMYVGSFTVRENGQLLNKRLDYSYVDKESHLITLIRSDITKLQQEQIAQEERLRAALSAAQQASVAKSEFLSRMSHEIRTPMNAIIGLDTIALRERNLTPVMEDHLKKIGISARFLLSLINDILDMSRIESGKMFLKSDNFDFHALVDNINSIVYPQCRERGIEYECVINGGVEESYIGDETKLQQVLLNILGNSIKFTPNGGKIHLLIEQLSHDQKNARLRFTIADTGQGINPEFIPHLFEAFSQEDSSNTTVYGGTGLGLAICKNIVEMMDGTIHVHSVKHIGSDFTIELSLGLSENTAQWNAIKPVVDLAALKTLIVDDDVIVCQHTKIVLEQAGIDAEWVDSGVAAVKRVAKQHTIDADYKLILLDWKMPDMDGIETARQIRTIVGPDITIIILSAYDWGDIEEEAREAGVDNFIRKPVFASSVIRAFSEKNGSIMDDHREIGQKTYDFTGYKVLLVEDNLINAEIGQSLLEMAGFEVDTAHNGVEALQLFTNSKEGEYAAILMDIRMPLMDGLEASRAIRGTKKKDAASIPIIAMSANAFEEDVQKSLDHGMNAHLTKPIDANVLYETLCTYIKP